MKLPFLIYPILINQLIQYCQQSVAHQKHSTDQFFFLDLKYVGSECRCRTCRTTSYFHNTLQTPGFSIARLLMVKIVYLTVCIGLCCLGCLSGISPHLPELIPFLINSLSEKRVSVNCQFNLTILSNTSLVCFLDLLPCFFPRLWYVLSLAGPSVVMRTGSSVSRMRLISNVL